MKRDMDLIRQLLLRIEELPLDAASSPAESVLSLNASREPLCLHGESPADVHYNMKLLADAGFIDLHPTQFAGGFNVRGLTWRGHDFLDSVRDDLVWKKTKEGALAAGGFTFELLTSLAKGLVKKQIEKHTGIEL
jgi:hypothetical protein